NVSDPIGGAGAMIVGMARTPFLQGALSWVYDGDVPDACAECGYDWSTSSNDALAVIADSRRAYADLLDGRDGTVPADDGGWNATAYVYHLADLARSWSERWVLLAEAPDSLLAGWDPDEIANARNYRNLPTVAALWSLDRDVSTFVELSTVLDHATTFQHGDWGTGSIGDALVWLGHEFGHHQLDVAARAR
ncbi:MAG: hypothetical protein KDB37_21785, partial [Ilumatobacter sp.]|nr:hypothetical protein [Ilumatobacter sp.]